MNIEQLFFSMGFVLTNKGAIFDCIVQCGERAEAMYRRAMSPIRDLTLTHYIAFVQMYFHVTPGKSG